MKKIIAFILALVICLAVVACDSKEEPKTESETSKAKKDILGEWISFDEEDEYVKFFEDGTGELKDDGMMFDFEWEYDTENKNYRANVAGAELHSK